MVIRALDLLKAGNLGEAERLMHEALEVARRGHHPIGEGMAALCLSNIYWGTGWGTGRALLARELARRARDIFRQQTGRDQRHNEAVAAFNLGLVHHLMGDHFEALNEYYAAQELLDTARRYWVSHNQVERVSQCDQLETWIQHLTERVITSNPQQRSLTLFLPIGFVDGATAALWGEHAKHTSVLLEGKTLKVVPLREWLVLTADCCVFPLPDDSQVHQLIQQQVGEDGDYILAQPGEPLPDDPFYISVDAQGITEFIRQRDGTLITPVQPTRIIGGPAARYRPVALAAS